MQILIDKIDIKVLAMESTSLYKKGMVIAIVLLFAGCRNLKRTVIKRSVTAASLAEHHNNKISGACRSNVKAPIVTVWIHGTKGVIRFLSVPLVKRYIDAHAGLNLAQDHEKNMYQRRIAEYVSAADNKQFPLEHFYLFGWSGELSFDAREKAARVLHDQLSVLAAEYQEQYGVRPFIRLVTHSHGGNVALNLAKVAQELKSDVRVDQAVLLACPVQDQTSRYVHSDFFGKVYSLYASSDMFQVVDPQGVYSNDVPTDSFFSRRRFACGDQLSQVQIKVNRRSIMHVEFIVPYFLRMLPYILTYIDDWDNQEQCRGCQSPDCANRILYISTKKIDVL